MKDKIDLNLTELFYCFINNYSEEIKTIALNKINKIDIDDVFKSTCSCKVSRLSSDIVNEKINKLINDEFKLKLNSIVDEEFNKQYKLVEDDIKFFVRRMLFSLLSNDDFQDYFNYKWDDDINKRLSSLLFNLNNLDK